MLLTLRVSGTMNNSSSSSVLRFVTLILCTSWNLIPGNLNLGLVQTRSMAKLLGPELQDFQVHFPPLIWAGAVYKSEAKTDNKGSKQCLLHPSSGTHTLDQCKRFLSMGVEDRWIVIKDNKLCFMCLGYDHVSKDCKTDCPCNICKKPHHCLLHPVDIGANNSPLPDLSTTAKTTSTTKPKFYWIYC